MSVPFHNEGVGQGGFIGVFSTAGNVILESWAKDTPSSHIINQPDQYGGPLKWAGVAGFETASALAQLPFDGATLTEILLGETVDAPADHGGGTWVVIGRSETFQIGDYFKANLSLQKKYN